MIDFLQDKLSDEDLLNAPKIKRTHCYANNPARYDIVCLLCGGTYINWSEWEDHLWCYNCEKDIFIPREYAGIFSGPVPIEVAEFFVSFDRVRIDTGERIPTIFSTDDMDPLTKDLLDMSYASTWVDDPGLKTYEKMLSEKLDKAH